jgi:UDP-N-acetylmuramoyl-tripeptide--D-alanyl-D-alanine ligase
MHHVLNAAAAAVVASVVGADSADIAAGILGAEVPAGRGVLFDLGGIIVFDDSYNSNPASLKASVGAFMEIPDVSRRWLVLGDMLELGESSERLHREAGILCGRARVDGILTIGTASVELSRAAAEQRKSPEHITHFLDAATLAAYLNELLVPGDAVLIKGSRAMHMEKVLESIGHARGASPRRVD